MNVYTAENQRKAMCVVCSRWQSAPPVGRLEVALGYTFKARKFVDAMNGGECVRFVQSFPWEDCGVVCGGWPVTPVTAIVG